MYMTHTDVRSFLALQIESTLPRAFARNLPVLFSPAKQPHLGMEVAQAIIFQLLSETPNQPNPLTHSSTHSFAHAPNHWFMSYWRYFHTHVLVENAEVVLVLDLHTICVCVCVCVRVCVCVCLCVHVCVCVSPDLRLA